MKAIHMYIFQLKKKNLVNYSLDINYTYRVVLDSWSSKFRILVTSWTPEVISSDPLPIAFYDIEL